MDKLPHYPLLVKGTRRDIAVTLNTSIEAGKSHVFDFIAAEGVLPIVLTGYSPFLPAVVATSGNTGPWDRPGSSRLVHLKDGNTAVEEVTGYDRPDFFSYKSSRFTFALKYLATGATGEWWFETDGSATKVRWTYTFKAKNLLATMILPIFARFLWSGYMRVCFFNTEKHFANQDTSGTTTAEAVRYTKA